MPIRNRERGITSGSHLDVQYPNQILVNERLVSPSSESGGDLPISDAASPDGGSSPLEWDLSVPGGLESFD